MAFAKPVLLVIDDEPGVVAMIERFARGQDFDVITYTRGRQVLAELGTLAVDVALVDLQTPEVGGLDVLRAIREAHPMCGVILMTAHATVESAIEAVKLGALDYLSKPIDFERLATLLVGVRYGITRREDLARALSAASSRFEFRGLIGLSPVMQEMFDTIRRLAPHVRTALIAGETGTGKELVARALHNLGPRRDRPFVAFNCSAIVETLFESEFFGHTRGAFTGAHEAKTGLFEVADGATLFLDEISELPRAMQAKLLRVVEYGEVQRVGATSPRKVDVRIIVATNRILANEVAAGRFRQDLYYRLNVVEIVLPPLRDRREDIPYLAASFIKEFAKSFDKPLGGLSLGAERLLCNAPWPGNVRELRNTLERACMLSEGRVLNEREISAALARGQKDHLPAVDSPDPAAPARIAPPSAPLQRERVEQVLQQVGGNRSAAARAWDVSRRALYRRLDSFGLR
jgi:two-component system response regulator HydG